MGRFVQYGEPAPGEGLVSLDAIPEGYALYDESEAAPPGFEVIFDPRMKQRRELRPPAPPPVVKRRPGRPRKAEQD